MENETFKVAKEILEKYAPHQLQSMTSQTLVSSFFLSYTRTCHVSQYLELFQGNQRMMQSSNNKPQYASSNRPVNRVPNMGRPPAIMSSSVRPSECYLN